MVKHAEEPVVGKVGGRFGLGSTPLGSALKRGDHTHSRRLQRTRTLGSLLKSISTGVIFTIVVMMTIAELGYKVGPLLARPGILGVALGSGAQATVWPFQLDIFMLLLGTTEE